MGGREPLEIEENPAFHRRDWRAQRLGWALLALVVLMALLGGFGRGILARGVALSPDRTFRVRYERLVRRHAPARLEFTLAPGLAASDGLVRIWLDRRYAADVRITDVQPEPAQVSVTPALLIYSFAVADGGQPVTVTFGIEHHRVGRSRSRAGVLPQGVVTLGQFVYP